MNRLTSTIESLRRHLGAGLLLLSIVGLSSPVTAQDFDLGSLLDDSSLAGSLDDFHAHLSGSIYAYPRQPGEALGVTGFELFVDGGFDLEFADEAYVPRRLADDLPLDSLTLVRVGVRKGLPGGFDLGASYGVLLGTDLEVLTGELQWSILRGGALKPALAIRITGSQSNGVDEYELEQYGINLIASKGFANLTPYVGVGLMQSDADVSVLVGGLPLRRSLDESTEVLFGGVKINLLIPRITIAVERAETWQAALRIGIGF